MHKLVDEDGVDRDASGTSSKSTKLVHGGLRYLKQWGVKEVSEIERERAVVYESALYVTTPNKMLPLLIKGVTFNKLTGAAGLTVYDRLAKVKRNEQHTLLNKKQVLEKEPLLRKYNLKGGRYYVEYRIDDARLTLEVAKAGAKKGAKIVNYMKAEELLYENGNMTGVRGIDLHTGNTRDIRARKVVNATGLWVDALREDRSNTGKQLHLTEGVHITIDGKRFPLDQAVYFDTLDDRLVFAIRLEGKTYIGTTDTNYYGEINHLQMTVQERDYLSKAVNFMFPKVSLKAENIESSWADDEKRNNINNLVQRIEEATKAI